MIHPLWETNNWSNASDEAIISALFNAPRFVPVEGMGWIRRNRPSLIRQYQNMFYRGEIPTYAATLTLHQ